MFGLVRRKHYDLLVDKKDAYMFAYLSLEALVERTIDANKQPVDLQAMEAVRADVEFNLSATLDEIWEKRNKL